MTFPKKLLAAGIIAATFIAGGLMVVRYNGGETSFVSIEEKVAVFSPAGVSGGVIIPASCESAFQHTPGECAPLACAPVFSTTTIATTVRLTASNGKGPAYAWSAPGGAIVPLGSIADVSYASSGLKTVTVTSGSESAACAVSVSDNSSSSSSRACTPSETPWTACSQACNGTQRHFVTDSSCNIREDRRSCSTSACANPNAPQCAFEAHPSTIVPPQSSNLVWTCVNTTACSIDQGIGSVDPVTGSVTVHPTSTTAYRLTCDGPEGIWFGDQTIGVTVKPKVIEVAPR